MEAMGDFDGDRRSDCICSRRLRHRRTNHCLTPPVHMIIMMISTLETTMTILISAVYELII